jgi:pyruvate kinase
MKMKSHISIPKMRSTFLGMTLIRDNKVEIDVLDQRFRKATKQLSTLGPASNTFEMIEKLFLSGADVFRLNFSHGEHAEKAKLVDIIRAVEKKYDHPIGILGDLQGPKLRVGTFVDDKKVFLEDGQEFEFDLFTDQPGNTQRVSLPHPEILNTLQKDDVLLLDDGKLRMKVLESTMSSSDEKARKVKCQVLIGGALSNRKGVNTPSIILPLSPLTDKDRKDLDFILTLDIDWVALSFVQTPDDIREIKGLAGDKVKIMAKLEKPSAVGDNLDEIVHLSDGIMVARGDLGVEMNPWDVPVIQKRIEVNCKKYGRPCVIATQMMESMIENPTPTRAEASDCATAIFDSADAVMLSAESAAGKYPVESVTMQQLIINKVENDRVFKESLNAYVPEGIAVDGTDPTIAITLAARQVAEISESKALICFTSSGGTVLRASRFRPNVSTKSSLYILHLFLSSRF